MTIEKVSNCRTPNQWLHLIGKLNSEVHDFSVIEFALVFDIPILYFIYKFYQTIVYEYFVIE